MEFIKWVFLVRHVLKEKKLIKKNKYLSRELLNQLKSMFKEILNLLNNNLINGCANITGGGIADNLKRIILKI